MKECAYQATPGMGVAINSSLDRAHESHMAGEEERLPLSKFDSQALMASWGNSEEREEADSRLRELSKAFYSVIQCVGEDPERDGLKSTPLRAAKAFCYFTKGYEETINGKPYATERMSYY